MRINPDNKKIRYSGRIDWTNPKEPIWVYPCTSVEFKFTGKYLKIFLKNKNEYWQNYLGCVLDGVQLCYYLDNKKENEIEILVPDNENGETFSSSAGRPTSFIAYRAFSSHFFLSKPRFFGPNAISFNIVSSKS